MSWSDSLLSPPDDFQEHNAYLPQNRAGTNIVLPPLQSNAQTYPFTFERPRAPRLTSPRLLRDTIFPPSTAGIFNPPQLPRPIPGDFDNTLRDVQSALHNADMALRNAQAAFRHSRATRSATNNIVDLTGSDDIAEDSATSIGGVHGADTRPAVRMRAPRTGRTVLRTRQEVRAEREVIRQDWARRRALGSPVHSERSFSDSAGYIESDEYDGIGTHQNGEDEGVSGGDSDDEDVIETRIPPIRELLQQGNATSQADRSAVRRQRQARRDWERVERRNRERAQQQAQNEARDHAQRDQVDMNDSANTSHRSVTRRSARRQNSNDSVSEVSAPSIDLTQNSNDQDLAEPVDLTGADDDKTLKNILAKEQQDAIAAQPKPPSAGNTASSLSNYKCAICMDSPTNATTTICGHLFCHRCILDSLKWSERQRREDALHPRTVNGLCPVCRKSLKNKEVSAGGRGTGTGGLVNLEIKKIPRKQYNDDKQRERFLADIEAGKGKQRANTDEVTDIENLDTRDDGEENPSKAQRKRRRVQS